MSWKTTRWGRVFYLIGSLLFCGGASSKEAKQQNPLHCSILFAVGLFCVWGCSHYCFCMFNSPSLISNDKWTLNWSCGWATSTLDVRHTFYLKFILTRFLIFQMSFISAIWHQVFRSIVIIGPYYLNDHWFCCWRWNDQRHNWRSAAVSVRRHQQPPNIYSAFGVYIIAESQSTLELRSSSQFLKLLRVSLDE